MGHKWVRSFHRSILCDLSSIFALHLLRLFVGCDLFAFGGFDGFVLWGCWVIHSLLLLGLLFYGLKNMKNTKNIFCYCIIRIEDILYRCVSVQAATSQGGKKHEKLHSRRKRKKRNLYNKGGGVIVRNSRTQPNQSRHRSKSALYR